MLKFSILLVICLSFSHPSLSRKFTSCELATELSRLLPEGLRGSNRIEEIANWVCIARQQTGEGINTGYMRVTPSHNVEMGLFKISAFYYCEDSRFYYNDCNLHCEKLVDDDIEDDLRCAQLIKTRQNGDFKAWDTWKDNCSGKDVVAAEIAPCNITVNSL